MIVKKDQHGRTLLAAAASSSSKDIFTIVHTSAKNHLSRAEVRYFLLPYQMTEIRQQCRLSMCALQSGQSKQEPSNDNGRFERE